MNYAEDIKRSVSAFRMAETYGFKPDRAGFINCPFHSGDHSASLKLYGGQGGFHCFGCHTSGSVIDFTMRLFDIDFQAACRRINDDFSLGLPIGAKPSLNEWNRMRRNHSELIEKINSERQDEEARQNRLTALESLYDLYDSWIRLCQPKNGEPIDPRYVMACKEIDAVYYDILSM